ncbi:MAG: trigger factor [Anaerotignum sp.]|jgi:trigger factor|nr:trigger factor [Anaerotignum sp.]MCI8868389.1 trigger factor [Anaerotignum sp.]
MNAVVLNKEKTDVKFSFEVSAEVLEQGMAFAYNKHKNQISIPGFRKGKVPRKLIEAQYGEGFFYEDAINHIFPDEYMAAVKELGLDVVSAPTLDVDYIESGKGAKFVIDVVIKPEVALGQYKGLEVEKVSAEVTEDEVLAELKKVQNKNARTVEVTDRAAEMGDIAKISYEGSVDGVPFDGGKADNHELELGSHQFIAGFEEQVAGHSVGEKFDINVTFPEQYHAPELAGKAAVFAIELKALSKKELPELNDAFAEDVSEFATLDEYKANILEKLAAEKTERAKQLQGDKLLDAAVANCTMEVPQVMYDNKINSMMREFEENITRQGLTMDIYYQYMGTDEAGMRENFKDTGKKSVDARLMLEAIAKAENLVISEEELKAEICRYGESYGIDEKTALEIFRDEDKEMLKEDMLVHAAMKLIEDTAVLTEPKAE